jgi:hypothetical protein
MRGLPQAAMKHSLRHFVIFALLATTGGRLSGDALYDAFREPKPETRPFVRWWWNGGRVDATEVARELDVMKAAGIGGVEINTIGMPEGASAASKAAHPAVTWLSPEWSELVRSTAAAARDRGLTADLIVGSGWPFGGRFLAPAEQTQRVLLTKRALRGPAQVALTRAELLAMKPAGGEKSSEVAPVPTSSQLLFVRLLPADALHGTFAAGRELLPGPGPDDRIVIDVPPGEHVLYVGSWQMGFTHVKLGAPGADGPVVNHFDAAAVRKYLDHMSANLAPALHGSLGNALRAMFVDSLELDHANWTGDLAAEFLRRRGYDLLPYLPFVLDGDGAVPDSAFKLTIRRARYDFDRTLIELFDERFLSTYVAWAEANQVKARIQAYGRETHPLHGSMKAHLPEGETWLWVDKLHPERIRVESTVVNRYVASAANLTGQRLRSFEAMTNAIPVFRETLQDFKLGFDASLLAGLNHPIIHGFNYTPPDAGFPGWVRFGCYLNERTPWWPYFRQFSDYAARLGTIMRGSTARARLAVLAPRPDEWAKHGLLYQPFPEVAEPWYQYQLMEAIPQAGYNADYISEKILIDGTKRDGRLAFGPCAYDVLILEDVGAMEPAAAAALQEFVAGGGHVVCIGAPPSRAPGLREAAGNDALVGATVAEIRRAHPERWQSWPAPENNSRQTGEANESTLLGFATALLAKTGLPPDVIFDRPRRQVAQISQWDGARAIYFIANSDARNGVTIQASFPGATGRPYLWDPHTGSRRPVLVGPEARLRLELEPAGSALVVFEPQETAGIDAIEQVSRPAREIQRLTGPWKLQLFPAAGGGPFTRELAGLVDLSRQEKDDPLRYFGGVASYEIEFDGANCGNAYLDLGEVHDVSEVTLNGVSLGSHWWGRHGYALAGKIRPGRNRLQVKVATTLVNLMRGRDDDTARRWAGWAPPIPNGLLGPVRLLDAPPLVTE